MLKIIKIQSYILVFLCLSTALSSCGVKPKEVDPPPGAENRTYPNVYPDLRTDPGYVGGH